jgi:hypothetical protein
MTVAHEGVCGREGREGGKEGKEGGACHEYSLPMQKDMRISTPYDPSPQT